MHEVGSRVQGADFTGTPYVPVYTMLAVSGCFSALVVQLCLHCCDFQSYQVLTPQFLCFNFLRFYLAIDVMIGNFLCQTGVITNFCQLLDPEGVRQELRLLKSLHVDGVIVECWWGIVEAWTPQKYEWSGYRELFTVIQEFQLKLQVVQDFDLLFYHYYFH